MKLNNEKSDSRINIVVMTEAYQMLPALLMSMTPIVIDGVPRENAKHWKVIAEHFGYCFEWVLSGIECSHAAPEPCPFDLGEIRLDKVSVHTFYRLGEEYKDYTKRALENYFRHKHLDVTIRNKEDDTDD